MKKIYILLMHTNTFPSKLIKFFTRYKYTHVALSLDGDCNTIYSFGRKSLHSIFHGGFVIEKQNGMFFQTFHQTICQVYEMEVSQEQYDTVKRILSDMTQHIHIYKYDFFGLIPRYFGIPVTIKNKYVCSFFVAEVLEKANLVKFPKKVCFVHPKDFTALKELNKIYEGSYLAYRKDFCQIVIFK